MKKLRVGLIGSGQIARVSHIPAYRKAEDVEIVAVSDVRLESAQQLAQEFGIPAYYADHKRMLEECELDMVSVCVPNKFHCPITLDALHAGCHVLCEKPPAMTAEEAEAMARAAEEAGKVLAYGFHLRYDPRVQYIRQQIEEGAFGTIYAADVAWLRRRGVPGWGVFTNREIQGGGPLIDIGAHVLDIAAYLLNYPEVEYVCADMFDFIGKSGCNGFFGSWNPEKYTVEDSLMGQIHFKNGSVLRLSTSFALNMKEKDDRHVLLYGEKQGASLFPLEIYGGTDGPAWNQSFPFHQEADLHEPEILGFVAACRGVEQPIATGWQGVYIQKLIAALYESARQRKPVYLS